MSRKKRLAALQKRAQKAKASSMRRHVLVCTGSDCDESKTITKRIRRRVNVNRLRDTTTVTKVSCLDICKSGPICVVYPEGAWYHSVDEEVADQLVDTHLRDGELVERHIFLRNNLQDDPATPPAHG